jgi:nitroreductase
METAPADKQPWMEKMIRTLSDPLNNIFYDAPLSIMIFAAPTCLTPVEDGSLAAGNMMLAAWSMGVGSCWIGFASSLQYSPEFMAEVEIPEGDRLIAAITFGYPAKIPAKGNRKEAQIVKWFR